MKIIRRFLLGFFLGVLSLAAVQAMGGWDEFELIHDKRNSKESSGGKGVPPQGRILDGATQFLRINEERLNQPPTLVDKEWRYVVTMNCKRGGRAPQEMIEAVATKLCPPSQRHRLAFILGINDKATVDSYAAPLPSWASMGIDVTALEAQGIPILVAYFQWTPFWEKKGSPFLSASQIRKEMDAKVKSFQNERQRETALKDIKELEAQQQYPFGEARTFLLQNSQTEAFVTSFAHGQDVYIHIQDSDFVEFQEKLLFGEFPGGPPLVAANDNYLLARYDDLITQHRAHHTQPPVILGGAHVYSPDETLEDAYLKTLSPTKQREKLNSIQAKHATRFGSEMGNNLKHLIGIQQPYGLYFHEPNTLILSPVSAKRRMGQTDGEFKTIYARLARGFHFGIDSEVQDFTRMLFQGLTDDTCRRGMVFSATTVLSTSMKRSKKPFAIRSGGAYDLATHTFRRARQTDLKALRGMSQEIIHPNKWGSNLATSFSQHKVHDARTQLYQLFAYFDPLELLDPADAESYQSVLVDYDQRMQEKKEEITNLFRTLQAKYDALKQGKKVAFQMVSIAWESGQMMRFMLLDHFVPPSGVKIEPTLLEGTKGIRGFLALRFNFSREKDSSLPVENPFVRALLEEEPTVKEVTLAPVAVQEFEPTSQHVSEIVSWFLKREGNVKVRAMRVLGVKTSATLDNLMQNAAPQSWKQIADKVRTSALIAQNFPNLSEAERQELSALLSAK